MERGVNSPHKRSGAQDDDGGVLHACVDGLWGEKESEEQVALVLVMRERRHKMTWAMLIPTRNRISLDCEESSKVH